MIDIATNEEVELFFQIKNESKISLAVVGIYDIAYDKGFREGKMYGAELTSHNGLMSWLAVVTAAFITGVVLGWYL